MPSVSRFMTLDPCTVAPADSMAYAHRLMRDRHIRHLPVVEGGRLVGIVSDRDLHLLETLRDVDPEIISVEEAMTREVYAVPQTTLIDQVLAEMVERRLGSVVVMGERGVVGIFTALDGLRALLDVLDRQAA